MEDVVTKSNRSEDVLIQLSLLSYDEDINVVLLSDSDEMKKLNYYIFDGVEGINYYTMDAPYDRDLSILSTMNFVLYNKDDKELEKIILENIEKKHIKSKFIYIVDKKRYKQLNLLEEYANGVDNIVIIDSQIQEYIYEIQRELRNNFYIKRLKKIKEQKILKNIEELEERINELIKNRIFFTKLRYKYESDMNPYKFNLDQMIRKKDSIYIDKIKKEIYFLLLNILPAKAHSIITKRVKNFPIKLKQIAQKNVFDLIYIDKIKNQKRALTV